MQLDDETTAIQLQKILADNGHPLTLMAILRSREKLGWTFRGSAYCHLIREVNKGNRLHWAQDHLQEACSDCGFLNVLWTDECSVMLKCHRHFCCRKEGAPARPKPRLATFNVLIYIYINIYVTYKYIVCTCTCTCNVQYFM